MVVFYDNEKLLTEAYKQFINPMNRIDLSNDFDKLSIDKKTLFACKFCKRLFLSYTAAMKHICSKKRKASEQAMSVSDSEKELICLTSDESSSEIEDVSSRSVKHSRKKKRKKSSGKNIQDHSLTDENNIL